MSIKIQADPTMEQVLGWADGTDLQKEAMYLESQGQFTAAEHKYLEAIRAKEAGFGPDHYTTGTSYDCLGELYLKMERIDKAEEYLKKALRAREHSGFSSDLAMTREHLGKLFEMKGDLQAAQEIRLKGLPDNIACGNVNCLRLQNSLKDLSKCSACKAVLYCSQACQKADWKRHRKYCRRIEGDVTEA
ncbi:hypothetical protein LXA43DRAFT_1025509 [Ganoderma leucocontextum]|nr:hypothetical protein LXA43DRAFT_1025509 [Ganoderma leucocontextum]